MKGKAKKLLEILIDTREQRELDFSRFAEDGVTSSVQGLKTGDYSLAGYETSVCYERKSLDDLVNTLIYDFESDTSKPDKRFNRELRRMQLFSRAVLIIEAQEMDLWLKRYRSLAEPSAVWGKLMSIWATFGIPFHFSGNRTQSAKFIVDFSKHYINAREKKFYKPTKDIGETNERDF